VIDMEMVMDTFYGFISIVVLIYAGCFMTRPVDEPMLRSFSAALGDIVKVFRFILVIPPRK